MKSAKNSVKTTISSQKFQFLFRTKALKFFIMRNGKRVAEVRIIRTTNLHALVLNLYR